MLTKATLNILIVGAYICGLLGCSSVHTTADSGEAQSIAIWVGSSKEKHEQVRQVLRDSGLHPTLDSAGVAVGKEESEQALRIILTDPRMKDSGLLVMVFAEAGTARPTSDGLMEASILYPLAHNPEAENKQQAKDN